MNAPAYIIEAARRQKLSLLAEFPELEHDEQALNDTLDGINGAQDFIASLIRKGREDEAMVSGLKELMAELKARSDRLGRRAEARKQAAFQMMQALEIRKLERPDFLLTVSPGRPRVVIVNDEQIPDAFVRIKREPDKRAIAEAIDRGETIPGAVLSNSPDHITIRTA